MSPWYPTALAFTLLQYYTKGIERHFDSSSNPSPGWADSWCSTIRMKILDQIWSQAFANSETKFDQSRLQTQGNCQARKMKGGNHKNHTTQPRALPRLALPSASCPAPGEEGGRRRSWRRSSALTARVRERSGLKRRETVEEQR